jgi:hypothetical protein
MSIINDGGPAFPVPMFNRQADGMPMTAAEFFDGGNGMTLRDYFAASSLAHIPALLDANAINKSVENIASWSYLIADAMLKERIKP